MVKYTQLQSGTRFNVMSDILWPVEPVFTAISDYNNYQYGLVLEPDSVSIYKFTDYSNNIVDATQGLFLSSLTGSIASAGGSAASYMTIQNNNLFVTFDDETTSSTGVFNMMPSGGASLDYIVMGTNPQVAPTGQEQARNYLVAYQSVSGRGRVVVSQYGQAPPN